MALEKCFTNTICWSVDEEKLGEKNEIIHLYHCVTKIFIFTNKCVNFYQLT